METVRHVLDREPQPPRSVNPKADRDLELICSKCMEKEPQRRYGSAEALAADLEHWLAGEPLKAVKTKVQFWAAAQVVPDGASVLAA